MRTEQKPFEAIFLRNFTHTEREKNERSNRFTEIERIENSRNECSTLAAAHRKSN